MKKSLYYAAIIFMYLAIPFCVLGFFGSFVSLKYEVDHGRFSVETNKSLTEIEKTKELQELDDYEMQLYTQAYILIFIAIILFIVATGLVVKRKKFIV